jgi:hypothetical protein
MYRATRPTLRRLTLVLASVTVLIPASGVRAGLVINATFVRGDPPSNMAGGGNLTDIFNTAISYWKAAFTDPNDNWVVSLQYQWAPLRSDLYSQFRTTAQGGDPHRIESGIVTFNNSSATVLFADPTPRDNSEYTQYAESYFDTPIGLLVVSWIYSGATGDFANRVDLLTIAEPEIGHALGLAEDNTSAESPIIVTPPRPFAGEEIPDVGTDHLSIAGALMGPNPIAGERLLISPVDVLAEAEISRFADPNLDPYAVPKPGTLLLLSLGFTALVARRIQPHRCRGPEATLLAVSRSVGGGTDHQVTEVYSARGQANTLLSPDPDRISLRRYIDRNQGLARVGRIDRRIQEGVPRLAEFCTPVTFDS